MNREIIKLINERLDVGAKKYGKQNMVSDGRDYIQEALEEALDCSVYLAGRLLEIKNNKEKKMGRAIDMENKIDRIDGRLKMVEDALEELIQTRVHHVDLTELSDNTNVKAEGVEVEPDEEFTPPAGKRKKTKRLKDAAVG